MGELLATGTTLAQGRYRIEGLIGGGGMAQVYRARDERLARTVALKAMRGDLPHDPGWAARFRREAQAMAALNHPNVVAVHDTGEEPGPGGGEPVPFIVMELVPGRSLGDHLRERGPLPVAEALDLAAQMLAALAAAHAQALVHRDIKPANVLLTGDGTAKVTDFGIAATAESADAALTRTGTAIGTPPYMSPEQVEGRRGVDGRSDLYSLGVVLFQMLSGRLPFEAASGYAVGYMHLHTAPPTLSEVGIEVPAPVQGLLDAALAKQPQGRFPDATTMRAAVLAAARADPPTEVVRTSAPGAPAPAPTRPTAPRALPALPATALFADRPVPHLPPTPEGRLRGALRFLRGMPKPSRGAVKFLCFAASYLIGWRCVTIVQGGEWPPLVTAAVGIGCLWYGGAERGARIRGPVSFFHRLLTVVGWVFYGGSALVLAATLLIRK
ncbi:serine/threonine-protein kinase [Streptomyces sp. NPDC098789]|uniref:serine/threonine-protein kinase n=1 Tax=Streptomyces sp. NPDC098789 TaxID=3366098 RepID=UPI00380824A7